MQRNKGWQKRWRGGLAGLVAISGLASTVAPPDELSFDEDDFKIPMWNAAYEVRGGMGYKDNVTLAGSSSAQGSAFWLSRAEAMFFRLPSRGWQFNFFATADDVRYFDAPSVDNEQTVMAVTQANKGFGHGWKSTLGFNYFYQNQVFDVSATYTNGGSIGVVRGHTLAPRWSARKAVGPVWMEFEFGGTRQIMETQLDSYWTLGPRLTSGLDYGHGSQLSVSYQWVYLPYDTREQSDLTGFPLTNTVLAVQAHGVELTWRHVPDVKKRWQFTTMLGCEFNSDNGTGFYDYNLYRASEQLRYRAPSWEVSTRVGMGFYDYANQTVSATDASRRQRTLLTASLRVEKKLAKHLKLHASYNFDRSLSQQDFDDYLANTVMGGFAFEF